MDNLLSVLVVEDDELTSLGLTHSLNKLFKSSITIINNASKICHANLKHYDLVFLDLDLHNELEGVELLKNQLFSHSYVIVTSARKDLNIVKKCYELGASDYLSKPYSPESLKEAYQRFCKKKNQLHTELNSLLLMKDEESKTISETIHDFLIGDYPLFVGGESGTGKTSLARFIYQYSKNNGPFVSINCSEINESTFESEMFGHMKGSFTGAIKDKKGILESADGGFLFLDEIATLSLNNQTKLLKAIEEKKFYPVGSSKEKSAQFKLICATCEDLNELIAQGKFRQDLYFRIMGKQIFLKPLRTKKHLVFNDFMERINKSERKIFLETSAEELLKNCDWQGNLREYSRFLDSLFKSASGMVTKEEIKKIINLKPSEESKLLGENFYETLEAKGLEEVLKLIEEKAVLYSLKKNDFKVRKTLSELKISNNNFYKIKMRLKKEEE